VYDTIVIGAGIVGCAAARELARRGVRVLVLERALDVAEGATKANSAIVHAGFDAKPGSLKAKFNIAGNALYEPWCAELGVEFRRNTSLVVAFTGDEAAHLRALRERGNTNGVATRLLVGDGARALEPNLSRNVIAALFAPSGGITCPYKFAIRLAEHAAGLGAEFLFDAEVVNVATASGHCEWVVKCADGRIFTARSVLNAAGVHAGKFNNMVSASKFRVIPRRGEYLMLDRCHAGAFNATIFQAPTTMGKGVLVSPTVDGTIIVGPTAEDITDPDDTATTRAGTENILSSATRVWENFPRRGVIAGFAGIRAHCDRDDFVIGEAPGAPMFFNAAGIESPGLTAAPAIAVYLANLIATRFGSPTLPRNLETQHTKTLPNSQISKFPNSNEIVCRCENITESEIRAALRGAVPARTLDGLKRRVRVGMGRCQGGFCTSRVLQIMSEELGVPENEIVKFSKRSKMLDKPLFGNTSLFPNFQISKFDSQIDSVDLIVIGAGPAGLAAAIAARKAGVENILVLERDTEPGGILKQCIHTGFGVEIFKEELTGPEYAQRYINEANDLRIPIQCSSMVPDIGADKKVRVASQNHGGQIFHPKAIVLAMGCREKPRGALMIPGTRPAGIYTAGLAQKLVNLEGWMPGRRVVVLGSGDIGLIMARRMVFEGAEVLACVELAPKPGGLARNVAQCLNDFDIPLVLESTVTEIHGRDRLEGVTISQMRDGKPVSGTERYIACDTLLLSVGLLPENELPRGAGIVISDKTGGPVVNNSLETSIPGIFACGNVLHVNELVDHVTIEAIRAGEAAAEFILKVKN